VPFEKKVIRVQMEISVDWIVPTSSLQPLSSTAVLVREFLTKGCIAMVPHSPYSPDLFHFIQKLKYIQGMSFLNTQQRLVGCNQLYQHPK
jgi:hypothetical protein